MVSSSSSCGRRQCQDKLLLVKPHFPTHGPQAAHGAVERLEPCAELVPRCGSKGLQGRAWLIHGESLAVPAVGASSRPHGCVFGPIAGK